MTGKHIEKAAGTAPISRTAAGISAHPKQLARLLRQLLPQPLDLASGPDGDLLLGPSGRPLAPEVLAEALSLGLVRRHGRTLVAMPEARSFLRRAQMEGEEAFAEQHRDRESATIVENGESRSVSRNLAESPLAGLSRLKAADGAAYFPVEAIDAGNKLLADFTRAQLQPRITSSWEPRLSARPKGSAGGVADITASAAEARKRFGLAMEALGPDLSGVAADVCCFGKGLELVERERKWPARSAKLMLRTALMALSRHYAPPLPKPGHRSHHWGTDDFRPEAASYGQSSG